MQLRIRVGLEYERLGHHGYVKEIRTAHNTLLLEAVDGSQNVMSTGDFCRAIVDGQIKILVRDGKVMRPVDASWRDRETVKASRHRMSRSKILELEASEVAAGKTQKAAREAIEALCCENGWAIPSERSLRRWRHRNKQHEMLLAPRWSHCGNRYQGPDELLLDAMKLATEALLNCSDRITISQAWKDTKALYAKRCQELNIAPRPCSQRQLSQFMKRMQWNERVRARLDGRTASAVTRLAILPHKADYLREQVEMDAQVLDIFVRDEEGNAIGRPILYAAVDVASGYPISLYLTIQRPSLLPFLEAVKFMYFDAAHDFSARYGIKHRIDVFGKPDLLRLDNGSEFISEHATALAKNLFGDKAHCKPYKPEQKPHVERFNGIVAGYVKSLPGATKSGMLGGTKRTPPKSEVLLTLDELTGRLYRFIYDDYAFQPNELRSRRAAKAVAPYDIWNEMESEYMRPVPVSREEFERTVYFQKETRVLGHEGIALDGLKYHSLELGALYQQHGPGRYEIHYSEFDANVIYVKSPVCEALVPADCKELDGRPLDRGTARLFLKELRDQGKSLSGRALDQWLADFNARLQEGRRAKGNRARNKAARTQEMIQAAAEATRPTMPKQPAQKASHGRVTLSAEWDFSDEGVRGRSVGDAK